MTRVLRAPAVLVCVAAVLALTGCGGSSKPKAASTPTPVATTASPTPTVAGPADPAAATAEIKANWATFFKTGTKQATAVSLLQDGSTLAGAIALAAQVQAASKTKESVTVTAVTFTSPTMATVTYTLYGGTAPLLSGATGTAVFEGGKWKVAKATFCTLVQLGAGGKPVPGC